MDARDLTVDPEVPHHVFRHVVGHLASGVTVVTTADGSQNFGMTASSVTSLSAEPPMMLACLNRSAPTSLAVSSSGVFGVNILGHGHEHLAQQFAAPSDDKFRGVSLTPGVLGVPLLSDALAYLECRVVEQVTGGTHTIFLGKVVHASAHEGEPLAYFRGGFGRFQFGRDDAVYQVARQRVLERQYGVGEVMIMDDLAQDLDADKASVFYALTRLTTDGLVQRDPDRGYVVVPFDAKNSDEAFDARSAIELGVIDLTIGNAHAEDLVEMRKRFEAMAQLLVGDRFVDFDKYMDANYAFHESVIALARNRALSASFGRLSLRSVMSRSFGATPVTSQEFIRVQRDLADALEAGDAASARTAVLDYTKLAKKRVREILTEAGGLL
ncbi:MAG: flavin reductase [Actinomycetes bacterium]